MVKNKLYKFGCSFSTHRFFNLEPGDYPHDPSNYASIVATHFDLEVEGFAREGQGNSFVLDQLNKNSHMVGPDDMVIVQLTNTDRIYNTLEFFGDVKIPELLEPPERLIEASKISKEDLQTFGYVYTTMFQNKDLIHNLYCDSIVSTCLTLPCNSIILPFTNRKEYEEKFTKFDKIIFSDKPWNYMHHDHDNFRFDHLTDELHNRIGHNIIRDIERKL